MKTNFPCFFFFFVIWLLEDLKLHVWLAFLMYGTACPCRAPLGCGDSLLSVTPPFVPGRRHFGHGLSGSSLTAVNFVSWSHPHKGGTRKKQAPLTAPPQQPHQALRGSNMGKKSKGLENANNPTSGDLLRKWLRSKAQGDGQDLWSVIVKVCTHNVYSSVGRLRVSLRSLPNPTPSTRADMWNL